MISPKLTGCAVTAAFAFTLLTGCKSKQAVAIDQAKQQAAATGHAQQVVSVDSHGTTTTTTVQPPAPGQSAQTVTTTVTSGPGPAPGSAPAPAYNNQNANQNAQNQSTQNQLPPVQQAQNFQLANKSLANQSAPPYQPGVAPAGPPTPGADPIIRPADVNVAAGTSLAIRINQHISVKHTPAGSRFTGEVVEPVAGRNNQMVIPKGARVDGVVDASHRRGHFKGRSILELRLTSLYLNGTRYPLDTHDLTRTKKGKGKRSAAFIGGGTGVGMLIGGVATGGVGLLIGGLSGAGAGTAIGGLTGNRDIDIPAESIVRFRLADDLVLQQ